MPRLVGEDSIPYTVDLCVGVAHFLAAQCRGVGDFERGWSGYGGQHVLPCLVHMALWCFICLGVVF